MYLSLSRLSSSLVHRLARCQGHVNASRPFSVSRPPGHPESFQPDSSSSENVARNSFPPNSSENVARNPFQRGFNSSENVTGNHFRPGLNFSENFSRNPFQPSEPGFKSSENFSGNPFQPGFISSESVARNSLQRGLNSSENVAGNSLQYGSNSSVNVTRNSRSMNFVRGIIEEDAKNYMWGSQVPLYNIEQNADIVHVKLMRNNTFVTVTDAKGNKKLGASAGSLSEMKGGQKSSKYAAEATAEHVGRLSRNFGVKSVVMKVKGFTFFKKKRQAIVSWKEGFTSSKVGKSPIVYIEDTTRKPHNGCRLPKKRRV